MTAPTFGPSSRHTRESDKAVARFLIQPLLSNDQRVLSGRLTERWPLAQGRRERYWRRIWRRQLRHSFPCMAHPLTEDPEVQARSRTARSHLPTPATRDATERDRALRAEAATLRRAHDGPRAAKSAADRRLKRRRRRRIVGGTRWTIVGMRLTDGARMADTTASGAHTSISTAPMSSSTRSATAVGRSGTGTEDTVVRGGRPRDGCAICAGKAVPIQMKRMEGGPGASEVLVTLVAAAAAILQRSGTDGITTETSQ